MATSRYLLRDKANLTVLAVASSIIGLIVSAPLLVADGHPASGAAIYAAFAPLCHQRADRSLFLAGLPMAVCTRCFGIYSGFTLGMFALTFFSVSKHVSLSIRWLALSLLPLVIDALGGWIGLFTNTHFSRWMTGMIAGAGVANVISCAIRSTGDLGERKWI